MMAGCRSWDSVTSIFGRAYTLAWDGTTRERERSKRFSIGWRRSGRKPQPMMATVAQDSGPASQVSHPGVRRAVKGRWGNSWCPKEQPPADFAAWAAAAGYGGRSVGV